MTDSQGGASAERRAAKGPDPLIGRVVNDRFRVVSLLARGGMGKVYRAEQAPLGREVALKVLNPNYSGDSDPEFHKRFFLEASTCSKLTHPNTVTIFDYGRTDDDIYYIAMELLEGRTLHRALRDDGQFAAARAMHVARQVCRSLREAHGLGVIHRDLKPANIYLVRHGDETDFVKVLDFGLVKDLADPGEDLTQTGLFMGSPKYMSPEQIRGEKVDARADIYALGVILYEMLTGKVPFDRPNSVNILMAHVHEAPPPLKVANPNVDVPPALEHVVMKALAKKTAERFSGMDELLAALKQVALDGGMSTTRSTDLGMTGEYSALQITGAHGALGVSGYAPVVTGSIPPPPPAASTRVATTEPELRAEGSRRRVPAIAAIAGGALLLVGIVGVAIFASDDDDGVGTVAASASRTLPVSPVRPEPTVEPPTPTPTPTPRVASTTVQLRSDPPGAMVHVDDRDYGPTPATFEWQGADAELGRRVTFRFELEGHRDYTVTRVITGQELQVEATLEPIERAPRRGVRPRRPPRRPERPEGGDPVGPVKGYKLDPY